MEGCTSSIMRVRKYQHVEGYAKAVHILGVTGEGQKTSSVLSRALSQIEKRFRQRQSDCLTEVGVNASPIVRRDRRDSTWILRGPSLVLLILLWICRTFLLLRLPRTHL